MHTAVIILATIGATSVTTTAVIVAAVVYQCVAAAIRRRLQLRRLLRTRIDYAREWAEFEAAYRAYYDRVKGTGRI
jgi:TRAP-type C4-dicarboxylate transport system permease large subunit